MNNTPSKKANLVDYASNSKSKKVAETPDRPEQTKIVSGRVVERKKSLGSKVKDQFVGEDAKSVWAHLLFDVIVPSTKNLLYDMVVEGARRKLYGGAGPSRPLTGRFAQQNAPVNYSAYSTSNTPGRVSAPDPAGNAQRDLARQKRSMADFSGVILETREEGLMVLDRLTDLIEEFGAAQVVDFYAMVGIPRDFTDVKYGWTSLAQAQVRQIPEGFLLDLPRPRLLE